MKVPLTVFLLFLQSSAASAAINTIYMLAMTSQPVGGTRETLCLQVYPRRTPISLRVTLEVNQEKQILLNHPALRQSFFHCEQFKVPEVNAATVASVHILIQGLSTFLNETKSILITPPPRLVLVETDKPIYKPGQTVKFRIVSLDSCLLTFNQEFPTIELLDPMSNRIGQWLNETTEYGMIDLSYVMSSDAPVGQYVINIWDKINNQVSQGFEIREYVLPKFEVTVLFPPVITLVDTQATLKVCANYTYGKPVSGSVQASLCRKHFMNWTPSGPPKNLDICRNFTMVTDSTGCGSRVVSLSDFRLSEYDFEDTISVACEVTEYGTGVVQKGSSSSSITSNIISITFEDTPETFKSGVDYEGKIKVTDAANKPIGNVQVFLIVKYGENQNETWTLFTDINGTIPFSLPTLLWGSNSVSLEASIYRTDPVQDPGQTVSTPNVRIPTNPRAYLWIQPFYSKSQSFLNLQPSAWPFNCSHDAVVQAFYIIQGKQLTPTQQTLQFQYMVMSKGSVVQVGQLSAAVSRDTVNIGTLRFPLNFVNALAPVAQVVIYTVLPSGEAVADSGSYPIQLCFNNKVSLTFPSPVVLPGSQTSLVLRAYPGSLCSVRAIDRSVLLLSQRKEFDVKSVYDLMPVQKLSGYPESVSEQQPYPCFGNRPVPEMLAKPNTRFLPISYMPMMHNWDVYHVFEEIGMKILTNAQVKKPFNCSGPRYNFPMVAFGPVVLDKFEAARSAGSGQPARTVRTFFPETWIWDLVRVVNTGVMGVKKTVPDTITSWSAKVFCTSPIGFGLTPEVELTTFQPFFISLTLPFSIVRGETFTLKASVFNYLQSCMMVKVTLGSSQQFSAQQCVGCSYTRCLCADESATFSWNIKPSALGEVKFTVSAEAVRSSVLCGVKAVAVPEKGYKDTVIQTLLVVAEGTKQSTSYNELLCPAVRQPVEKTISLKLPQVFVKGSVSASISVLGDLMGRALKNLDSLLAMPYGCGEQNMLLFAPDIYILRYLESSHQLTQQIKDKALTFLTTGYQRELSYKHSDGSYSAFGTSDPSGNTWLTAFVMKSFASAKKFVFIDQTYIDQAKVWLGRQQQAHGSFLSVGQLIHTDLGGGVSDEVTLTAYVIAALLESGTPTSDPVVKKGLPFLRNAFPKLNSTYADTLLLYAFTLAGDQAMRLKILTRLEKYAIVTDGVRHWRRERYGTVVDSLEVEMTSYVLLALLSGPQLQNYDLGYSATIIRWLIRQQNAFGGFSSTQDTVVAMEALAKYSAATYSPAGSVTVTVSCPTGQKTFSINQSNRLLLQEASLPDVPGQYRIKAEGQGCVFAQFTVKYNIPPPPDFSSFSIATKTTGQCKGPRPSIQLSVAVRYNGKRTVTNMLIIEVKLLSGFSLDEASLPLSNSTLATEGAVKQVDPRDGTGFVLLDGAVKQVDQRDGTVFIYLDGLRRGHVKTYTLVMLQDVVVQNLKPAVAKVYDYYETSDVAMTSYTSPCA
ncbi:alpha-2-macroglobulin-like protein 1 [Hoplias malabaricus]|uniref:alpha-2-macroglobulin-like protein 1 n=1 Tax=Hoplias malabaricus TaxID=27720 RepID=UPI003462B18E